MEYGLDISNLSIGYAGQKIQSALNFRLPKGKILALFGENGSGKSTLIKTFGGALSPLQGEISIDGVGLREMSVADRAKRMAFVLTDRIEIGMLNVEEFIAFGRYPYTNWLAQLSEKDRESIDNAIEYCGLESMRYRSLSDLSDGERQKVMIARALAQETPYLILDEPTTHLDFKNSRQIFQLIIDLKEKYGKTILISSHQLHAVSEFADYFLLLKKQAWVFCDQLNYAKGEKYCNFLIED